jgi:hypothetical protein
MVGRPGDKSAGGSRGPGPKGTGARGTGPKGTDPKGTDPRGTGQRGTGARGTDPRGAEARGRGSWGSSPSRESARGDDGRGERSIDSRRNPRAVGPRLAPTGRRLPEPAILDGITGRELDRAAWQQLRTLSKENAEGVAQHLVMVTIRLEEEDLPAAMAHAETAVRRGGRVPAVREAMGLVAYRGGDWSRALAEFRTARRLSGSPHLLPLMVDCERGLGRFERALELASSPDRDGLTAAERAELAIVVSGVRRDLGQVDAAVLGLEPLVSGPVKAWSARLFYAYADALLARGERERAREWFVRAMDADTDLTTDAGDRVDELDGVVFADSWDTERWGEPDVETGRTSETEDPA